MKRKKHSHKNEDTTVGSVAGLTGEPPVHKKKKKDISVLKRFIEMRSKSEEIMRKRIEEKS